MTISYEREAIKKTSYIQTHLVYANVVCSIHNLEQQLALSKMSSSWKLLA